MYNDLLYQIALTRVPQVGDVHAKNLAQVYGSAEAVFKAPKHQLEKLEGIGSIRAKNIKAFTQFKDGETEIAFLEKYHIAVGLAAVLVFYNVQPGTAAQLKN